MIPVFTDTHAHLDSADFAGDFAQTLERAGAAGIHRIVTIGTSLESSRRVIALAEEYPNVFAAIGIHPNNVTQTTPDFVDQLREMAQNRRVVAIGEIGLDYYRMPGGPSADNHALKSAQAMAFTQQLELAAQLGLNVVVHERDSWTDTVALLAPFRGRLRAVFHCFGKSLKNALELIDQGHLVSFTGIVTFKNAPEAQLSAGGLPPGSFMVETDCPYLAPAPNRGKRCEPAFTRLVAEKIAELRSVPIETLAKETEATANGFFRFP